MNIIASYFDELEKIALTQGRLAPALKKTRAGRAVRGLASRVVKKMRGSKKAPVKAVAHTLKDMSMERAIGTGIASSPATLTPVPGAHPAAMMAMNAGKYRKALKKVKTMKRAS